MSGVHAVACPEALPATAVAQPWAPHSCRLRSGRADCVALPAEASTMLRSQDAAAPAAPAALALPPDVLQEVLQQLDLHDLAHAMLACKALYALAAGAYALWRERHVLLHHKLQAVPRYAASIKLECPLMGALMRALQPAPALAKESSDNSQALPSTWHNAKDAPQPAEPTTAGAAPLGARLGQGEPQQRCGLPHLRSLTLFRHCLAGQHSSLAPLAGCRGLRELHLYGNNFSDCEVEWLAQLTALTALSIWDNAQLSADGAARLAALTGLQVLDFRQNPCALDPSSLAALLPALTRLHTFHAQTCRMAGALAGPGPAWRLLASLPHLASLNFANNGLADEAASHLEQLTRLTHLDVSGNRLRCLTFLRGLPELQSLAAAYNPELADWQGLRALSQLTSLDMGNYLSAQAGSESGGGECGVQVAELVACLSHLKCLGRLCTANIPWGGPAATAHIGRRLALTHLDLHTCRLDAAAAAPLSALTGLQALRLDQNQCLGNAGVEFVSALTRLQELDLSHCGLGGGQPGLLCVLAPLTRLESLSMGGNRELGAAQPLVLSMLCRLTSLNLYSCGLRMHEDQPPAQLPASVRDLRVIENGALGCQGLAAVASSLSRLSALYASKCGLAAADAQQLARLPGGSLRLLYLPRNGELGDAGAAHIAELGSLTRLEMHLCGVTPAAAPALARLTRLAILSVGAVGAWQGCKAAEQLGLALTCLNGRIT